MIHYVYAHLDKGAPVYVGVGTFSRCYEQSTRQEPHKSWMRSKLPHIEVQIIASNVTKNEARSLEDHLISKLKPKYNQHVPVGISDGKKEYVSARIAAKAHRLPENTVKNKAYNNRQDWKRI